MIRWPQHRSFLFIAGGLLLIASVACNSIGLFNPTPPPQDDGLASTVAAMNATIEALEIEQQAQPTIDLTPNIIIVTATTTNTPLPSPTPISTPTALPTSTPVPLPTATHTNVPQGRTVVIIVTPTSSPSPTPYNDKPIIISPREGVVVAKGEETSLHWSWNGLLANPDEFFEIKLVPDGLSRSAYIAHERGLGHDFRVNLGEGRYWWTVQIVQGYYKNHSGHPDDWVFERFRSPESEPRLIIIDDNNRHDDDDDDDD